MLKTRVSHVVHAVATTLVFCSGCTRTSSTGSSDARVVQAQLDSMWSGLAGALMAGDTAKLGEFYSDTALFAETGSPTVRGLANLRAASAAVFACCRYLESNVQPEVTDVTGSRAFQFGTYRDVLQPAGQSPIAFYGRFSAVVDRDGANSWRVTRMVVIRDSSVPSSGRSR